MQVPPPTPTQNRLPQILATLLLIGLLATPLIIRKMHGGEPGQEKPGPTTDQRPHPIKGEPAIAAYGFALEEVAEKSGIQFQHQAPTLDAKLAHIMPEIASMGASVSMVDFDKDGWNDLYICNSGEGSKNHLYHNNHDGTFTDVAEQMGVADLNQPGTGVCMGAVWGDYDNDGFPDLLVYKWGKPELFHNDGGKKFTRVTDTAGALPKWANVNTAIWLDYDNDGKLDLLLCGYYPENVDLWHLKDTRMMPNSFEYAENGGRKYLLHNLGGGRFEDVTAKMGIDSHRWTLAAAAVDLRGTGYPDIVLANDYGKTDLYANLNGKGFKNIGEESGVGHAPKSGMSASFGDIGNTGRFAIYVSNISEEGQLLQGNNLWVPKEGKTGDDLQYDNQANVMGVENGGWSFGAQFGDLNNDGYQDIYVTNGNVSLSPDENYWYDFSKISGGTGGIISDAANWPPVRGRSHSGYQQKRVYLNDGFGRFTEVALKVGANDTYDGRSVSLGDLWNRGVLDIVVANQRAPLLLYKNTVTPKNQWADFDLEGAATPEHPNTRTPEHPVSNRDAVGALVRLTWNGHTQIQAVQAGSGFCAQNQHRLHFGLGANPKIEKAEIKWPSGKTTTLTAAQIRLGAVNKVKEEEQP